jgi:hypothetical protein
VPADVLSFLGCTWKKYEVNGDGVKAVQEWLKTQPNFILMESESHERPWKHIH